MTRKPAAVLIVLSLAVLALAALPASGVAAKGGNGDTASQGGGKGGGGGKGKGGGGASSSSLTLVMVGDANADGVPNWGDTITFDVSTTATSNPYVEVTCSQNGAIVYSAWAGFYDSYPWPGQRLMPLSSPSWTGGAADCRATLNTSLATLAFQASA